MYGLYALIIALSITIIAKMYYLLFIDLDNYVLIESLKPLDETKMII